MPSALAICLELCLTLTALSPAALDLGPSQDAIPEGARIVVLGNTFAERLGRDGALEAALHRLMPHKRITMRHIGWSADEVHLQPRPLNYPSLREQIVALKAEILVLSFGFNESFRGESGLAEFRQNYDALLHALKAGYGERTEPLKLILIGPIRQESSGPRGLSREALEIRNLHLEAYNAEVRTVAMLHQATFIDLFDAPALKSNPAIKLTKNGIHPDAAGFRLLLPALLPGFGVALTDDAHVKLKDEGFERLLRAVREKDAMAFHRIRPVNGEYIFGRRVRPFGIVNFPPEMERLDALLAEKDVALHRLALELSR